MNTISTALPSSFVARNKSALPRSRSMRTVFWGICALLAVVGFFTPNGLVTSAAFAVLPILGLLLWREGEPPVLLFGCAFQWLQATAAIFYTNHFGQTLEEAFGSNELSVATWLSILAVVVLAVGIRCGFIGAGKSQRTELESEASRIDINKIVVLYGASFVGASVLSVVSWRL